MNTGPLHPQFMPPEPKRSTYRVMTGLGTVHEAFWGYIFKAGYKWTTSANDGRTYTSRIQAACELIKRIR